MSRNRDRLFEMLENGELDAFRLAKDLMGYLSDDDCADFAHANDITLFEEPDDDGDDGDDGDGTTA